MKTKEEIIEELRRRLVKEVEMEKNSSTAEEFSRQSYHGGRKKAFKEIADCLVRWLPDDKQTQNPMAGR